MTRWFWLTLLLTVAGCLVTAATFGPLHQQLPARVPTHWDINGRPDAFVDRDKALPQLCFLPAMMLLILLLAWALPRISPEKFEVDSFRGVWDLTMALVAGVMLFLHVVIVYCSFDRQPPLDPTRPICTGILSFFVALGALMGRLQPNFWMGVRTPWTLTSPKVWQATHRLASRVFIVGGLVGLAIVWSNLPPAQRIIGMLAVLVLTGAAPLVHSLVYYKLLQRRGEL